jgi:hypothetical protein
MSANHSSYWVSEAHYYDEVQNQVQISRQGEWLPYNNIELKIDIFENRTKSWFLNHAHKLIETEISENGDSKTPGEYAAMVLACSQLEGFQKFREGFVGNNLSRFYFCKSIMKIFLNYSDEELRGLFNMEKIKEKNIQNLLILYENIRCGLFHAGFTDGKIYLNWSYEDAINTEDTNIIINPRGFVEKIIQYFEGYVEELRNRQNETLRENFVKRWDHLWELG